MAIGTSMLRPSATATYGRNTNDVMSCIAVPTRLVNQLCESQDVHGCQTVRFQRAKTAFRYGGTRRYAFEGNAEYEFMSVVFV